MSTGKTKKFGPLAAVLILVLVLVLAGGPACNPRPLPAEDTWQTRSYGPFTIRFHSGQEKLAAHLGSLGREAAERVREDLRLPSLGPVLVVIAETHKEFSSLQPAGTPVAPKWVAALAYPSRGKILMKAPGLLLGGPAGYAKIFFHEVAHIALERAMAVGPAPETGASPETGPHDIPRWLHEGYAIHVAREWSLDRSVILTRAVVRGSLIPLGRMVTSFPETENRARLAYAQSADLVHYLLDTYGQEAFHEFIMGLGHGRSFGRACREAFGVDLRSLEESWQGQLKLRHTWIPLLASTGTLWFAASLVFLAAYARKKMENRATLKAWKAEETETPPRIIH